MCAYEWTNLKGVSKRAWTSVRVLIRWDRWVSNRCDPPCCSLFCSTSAQNTDVRGRAPSFCFVQARHSLQLKKRRRRTNNQHQTAPAPNSTNTSTTTTTTFGWWRLAPVKKMVAAFCSSWARYTLYRFARVCAPGSGEADSATCTANRPQYNSPLSNAGTCRIRSATAGTES